jgi:hypothetical protein
VNLKCKVYLTNSGYSHVLPVLFFVLAFCGYAYGRIETPNYKVERKDGDFEVRLYPEQIVAETRVTGSLEQAGNKGFRPLFRYISGANRSKAKIAMTAPVGQEQASGEKIAMTAPVGLMSASWSEETGKSDDSSSSEWVVSFMMPASYTIDTLPEPTDEAVRLRVIPAHRAAAVTYSGRWHQRGYESHLARLRSWMKENDFQEAGVPQWARYNSPFAPAFLRRNEVLIPIQK